MSPDERKKHKQTQKKEAARAKKDADAKAAAAAAAAKDKSGSKKPPTKKCGSLTISCCRRKADSGFFASKCIVVGPSFR